MKKNSQNQAKPKKESRLEKVIVTLLVVLVSLLSFSVGVISGKGLSDKEYALKSLDQKYSHALNDEDAPKGDNFANELSDEEIEQLANAALENAEQAKQKNGGGMAGEVAGADIAGKDAKKEGDANKLSKEDEERVPSSVKPIYPSVGYTIQVAAYPTEKDASAKAATLISKGYAAFPLKVDVKGKTWYRVSVGSFKTRQEAMAYRADLQKQGITKDAIVQKLTK